ncbi:hypothetical protein Tco_1326383 [Tanacetum coccineum]
MLAPSGGGLILYQAYGNLYAMTGRKVHLLEDKQIPSVGVFSNWMAFRGNTRDLGSFGEETDEITDLHQIHEEILFLKRKDGVAGIKRRRRDPSSDGIRDLVTASGRGRLNEDLEYPRSDGVRITMRRRRSVEVGSLAGVTTFWPQEEPDPAPFSEAFTNSLTPHPPSFPVTTFSPQESDYKPFSISFSGFFEPHTASVAVLFVPHPNLFF